MQLFEMQGLLAGKCLPGDIKVNESLAEYLLRQLNQRNELAARLEMVNGIMDAATELNNLAKDNVITLQAKCDALAAENVALKERNRSSLQFIAEELGDPEFQVDSVQTPNTEAFTAELLAQGVDAFAASEDAKVEKWLCGDEYASYASKMAEEFAANLRAGRKG